MGSKFQVSNNFIENYLLYLIFNNIDLSNKDVLTKTHATFVQILQKNKGVGENIVFLDFDIKGDNVYIKVIPKNFISALWLSGIFPENVYDLIDKNQCLVDNVVIKFNKKTKRLTYKKKKNG
ncbi:MAG TPA: hypothetical protein PLN85_00055 [archaeon]|nr:hypothetical protein [archaeon]